VLSSVYFLMLHRHQCKNVTSLTDRSDRLTWSHVDKCYLLVAICADKATFSIASWILPRKGARPYGDAMLSSAYVIRFCLCPASVVHGGLCPTTSDSLQPLKHSRRSLTMSGRPQATSRAVLNHTIWKHDCNKRHCNNCINCTFSLEYLVDYSWQRSEFQWSAFSTGRTVSHRSRPTGDLLRPRPNHGQSCQEFCWKYTARQGGLRQLFVF